jgi:4-hydroxyproline epimerase
VIAGGPDLGSGPIDQRLECFRSQHDLYRSAIVNEPRGSDVLVGALLCEPSDPASLAGVIFFNNVGFLGMCGHGLIGVIETLKYLGRFSTGVCQIETPVGLVMAEADQDGSVRIANVESYRAASDVKVETEGLGTVVGDVAWGGNWFFLVREPSQELSLDRVTDLTSIATSIRHAVNAAGFPQVDHIELFGDATHPEADSKNFVLCPGLQYDRSPCGTGTSAKLACLAADGKLLPGDRWIQEGILGTCFGASYQWSDVAKKRIVPTIQGQAYISADLRLLLNNEDPFRWGIRASG